MAPGREADDENKRLAARCHARRVRLSEGLAVTAQHYLPATAKCFGLVRAIVAACAQRHQVVCALPQRKRAHRHAQQRRELALGQPGLLARLGRRAVDDANLSSLHLADGLKSSPCAKITARLELAEFAGKGLVFEGNGSP